MQPLWSGAGVCSCVFLQIEMERARCRCILQPSCSGLRRTLHHMMGSVGAGAHSLGAHDNHGAQVHITGADCRIAGDDG